MKIQYILFIMLISFCALPAQQSLQKDVILTSGGNLEITFIGHGSLMFTYKSQVIHIDPFTRVGDYSKLPDADLILITHHHRDHLDPEALIEIRTDSTELICTQLCSEQIEGGIIMKNGDIRTINGIPVEAVPMYNIVHKRDNGEPYHVKGEGNGYILTMGDKRIYVAGDTENTPEMKSLKNIDIAFLPMNVPYTMTPEMVTDAARAFMPKVIYPYHYGNTDTSRLVELLKDNPDIDVRIRKM
ncbi:MBL fold metallo-hydrolase [bacterium]|nr:MBL fold metallo-hydrolase [bacterium]